MPSASDPLFLTLDQVLVLHEQVLRFGGGEDGIINQGLLESAVNAPQATYGGKHLNSFPFEMAAAYIVSFARNHAFQDGNKRIAWAVAGIFLRMNGFDVKFPSTEEEVRFVVDVATGKTKKEAAAATLKRYAKGLKSG
jgi:death-on-curing protein